MMIKKHYRWLLPILGMLILTPFTPWLDLTIARYFYQPHQKFPDTEWFDLLFDFGPVPAEILAIVAALIAIASFFSGYLRKWRNAAFLLVATMVVGAGLITHLILKDHWGRPRPKQVIEFGGIQAFRPYYKPNFFHQPEPSKSFPCGHCTMGFYFLALALVGIRQKSKPLLYLGILLTAILGSALSVTRLAQGGHFLSDVLAAFIIMWLTALCFDWLLYTSSKRGSVST